MVMRVEPLQTGAAVNDANHQPSVRQTQLSRRHELRRAVTAKARGVHLALSQRSFVWTWSVLFSAHLLNGLAALGTAWLYFFASSPEMAFKFSSLQISVDSMRRSGWSFAAIAAAHSVVLLRMVYYSLLHRQLVFRSPTKSVAAFDLEVSTTSILQSGAQRLHKLWQQLRWPWHALFSQNGYFGLNGSLFEVGFEVREALEIALQTYQALALSRSVSRRWINSLAVLAIVTNCCATPLAHVLLRGHDKLYTRRILCLLSDMVLDTCCALVIPFAIALPYLSAYDPVKRDFPNSLYYDDVKYVNAIAEGRYIIITSVTDYISTLVPHVSIFMCLLTIESLLQRASTTDMAIDIDLSSRPRTTRTQVAPAKAVETRMATVPTPQVHQSYCGSKLRTVVHTVFVTWGLCVASVHLYAQLNSWDARLGCKLYVSAWFTQQFPCSVMEVNCYRQHIDGHADEITAVLHTFDRDALRALFITHCPTLYMPPVIQEFGNLGGLEVFNCSIETWGPDAAVHADHHASITYTLVMHSTVRTGGIPAGLLHANLPKTFTFVNFVHTNISILPDDIDVYWGNRDWQSLAFESTQLTHIPEAFARLESRQIAFDCNKLVDIPARLLENRALSYFYVAGNPLRALPDGIDPEKRSETPLEIDASNTTLTAIPTWLRDYAATHDLSIATMIRTPYCEATVATMRADTVDNGLISVDAELERRAAAELCRDFKPATLPDDIILSQRQP